MTSDAVLREHVVRLLTSAWAHVTLEDGIEGVPAAQRGVRPPGHAHTIWQLLEHIRLSQDDLVEYCRDASYAPRAFPEGYWPGSDAPEADEAWEASVQAVVSGLQEMVALVSDPSTDLFAPLPWSEEGYTVLREVLILADHNAYHLGQIVQLKKALGGRQKSPWTMP